MTNDRLRKLRKGWASRSTVAKPLSVEARTYDPLLRAPLGLGQGTLRVLGFTAAALGLHGVALGAVGVMRLAGTPEEEVRPDAPIEVQIVQEAPPIEEPAEEAPVAAPEPEPEPPKPPKGPDPVDLKPEVKEPPPPVRRVVGLTLESTVATGGGGPRFATGNTRMGKTDKSAVDPDSVEQIPKNQPASRIPTLGSPITRPVRRQVVKPDYPEVLRRQGVEADVVVVLQIDTKGRVASARIAKPSRYEAFNASALEAARREQFEPARRDGFPVAYTLRFTYRFRLEQ